VSTRGNNRTLTGTRVSALEIQCPSRLDTSRASSAVRPWRRKPRRGLPHGVHKSPDKGYSVEFAEHRQYYPATRFRPSTGLCPRKTDATTSRSTRRGGGDQTCGAQPARPTPHRAAWPFSGRKRTLRSSSTATTSPPASLISCCNPTRAVGLWSRTTTPAPADPAAGQAPDTPLAHPPRPGGRPSRAARRRWPPLWNDLARTISSRRGLRHHLSGTVWTSWTRSLALRQLPDRKTRVLRSLLGVGDRIPVSSCAFPQPEVEQHKLLGSGLGCGGEYCKKVNAFAPSCRIAPTA